MAKTKWWAVVLMLVCTLFTAFGQLYLKLGSETKYGEVVNLIFGQSIVTTLTTLISNPLLYTAVLLFIGLALYGLAAFLNIASFSGGEMSVLFPIFATNYIWVNLISWLILKEPMNILKWFGIVAIIIGISLIGMGSNHKKHKRKK